MKQSESEIWKGYYDVVILPPPSVRDYAIEMSRRLKKYGKFVLGKRRYFPHISLYHIPVRQENFESFRNEVERIAAASNGGELRLLGFEKSLLMTEKPKWLADLHRAVVRKTNKYFDMDYGAEDSWDVNRLPANLRVRAKAYLAKYGSPLIGAAFRPHITLTSLLNPADAKVLPPLPLKKMSFRADAIHICELGPSHSCQRIVAKLGLRVRFRAVPDYMMRGNVV